MRRVPDHLQGKFTPAETFLLNCIRDLEEAMPTTKEAADRAFVAPLVCDGTVHVFLNSAVCECGTQQLDRYGSYCDECGLFAGVHRSSCSRSLMRSGGAGAPEVPPRGRLRTRRWRRGRVDKDA